MNFDKLEVYAEEVKEGSLEDAKKSKLTEKIIVLMSAEAMEFPIQKDVLISNNTASYIYKDNKTYPNLFEFIAGMLHKQIPIVINDCKFGPGEIIVKAITADEALEKLNASSNELQKLINSKKGRI
jgi:hypothetical protein